MPLRIRSCLRFTLRMVYNPFERICVRTPRVTRRFLHFLTCWLLAASVLVFSPSSHAEGIELMRASVENTDEGYKLAASFAFELNRGLEEVITHGVPLHFTIDVRVTRPRWYWFDETAINTSRTIRIDYNVLTRQYRASVVGSLQLNMQQNFPTLDDALSLLRRPSRWVIAEKGALKAGEVYTVAVRMGLDLAHLPKPFQINALNNSDWRFASDWKRFTFKAE